jgi:hypothetical protein
MATFVAGTAKEYGWLIAKTNETMSGRIDFTSREAASGQAAQLIVEVQVPAPLPTVAITSPADGTYTDSATIQMNGKADGMVRHEAPCNRVG